MSDSTSEKEYAHPQYKKDREMLNQIMAGGASSAMMAELGRLRVRYDGFPGARDIQRDMDKVLEQWGISEAELFEKTRALHKTEKIFTPTWTKKGEDWS